VFADARFVVKAGLGFGFVVLIEQVWPNELTDTAIRNAIAIKEVKLLFITDLFKFFKIGLRKWLLGRLVRIIHPVIAGIWKGGYSI